MRNEDGSDGHPVAQRGKSTMAAIHPENDNRPSQVTKRLSDGDKKEIACSASSRLTLLPTRYPWSLIWSCGQFFLLFAPFLPLFFSLHFCSCFWPDHILSNLLNIRLPMIHTCQGKSILLMFYFNLLLVHSSFSACPNKATTGRYIRVFQKNTFSK